MTNVLRVGIVGAGGYTGGELVRLVHAHPRLELTRVFARENAGKHLGDVLPATEGLAGVGDMVLEPFEPAQAAELARSVDVAFTALPHAASARVGKALYDAGVKVVDLSADFRLRDAAIYERTYHAAHPAPELLAEAVYGLPELYRDRLREARLIAAPGCYPTSAILPLAPVLESGLVEPRGIVIDSKSGISGGGKTPAQKFHYPETAEGLRPYAVAGTHRHVPEIEQELAARAGIELRVVFTPQLVPLTRGILTCAYAPIRPGTTAEACRQAARSRYAGGLVTVLEDKLPDTLWVRGSARAHVAYAVDERAGMLLAMCAIDNLAKGASAQAIQALNASLGWPDALGLPMIGIFP